ncbi:hypothetical protein [Colwellia demingiae]|nr:hypothetical protein [Colwellia demingiae]
MITQQAKYNDCDSSINKKQTPYPQAFVYGDVIKAVVSPPSRM